ncbi:hypothetical protein NEF87_001483 [Candidatus Lokiarchaeum ossiferum]|uniref:N-acetyltransferase domain-containing protein n=1 Tax=Candidatus Lokiarchaeum ossiferum TaxID=2951803 RepID=A0ABY6HPE1_9ARCH|nr:hypothetical protein NEF87_001483 [Candidatus Lokiarchaeum sp. B-35]
MNIIYRNYQPGDEVQLAELFNLCFHQSGVGFLRTPRGLKYRYVKRPNFNPNEIQIAEDTHKKLIVGAVFSTLEEIFLDGKQLLSGSINDVAVHPNYIKIGIAKTLMIQALTFLKQQKCELSTLAADPKGHARLKLYIPLGWRDYSSIRVWISPNINFFRYLPLLSPLLFLFIPFYFYSKLKMRKIKKKMKDHGIHGSIIHPSTVGFNHSSSHNSFRNFYNKIGKQQRNGKILISDQEWKHFRKQNIRSGLKPTFIALYKKERIIGFASFLCQWIYFDKLGFKFPLATIREWGVDHSITSNAQENSQIYNFLLDLIREAALQRKCVTVLFGLTDQFPYFSRILKKKKFISTSGGVFMINNINPRNKQSGKIFKPFIMDIGEMFLHP